MRFNPNILLLSVLFLCTSTTIKSEPKEKINWMTVEEAQEKFMVSPKPIIIDLYTNWCYWCKVMDKKTYNNEKVIKYINKNFYAISSTYYSFVYL